MNNQQKALVKLAQLRGAINHVLRTRAMQKQAGISDLLKDLGWHNGYKGIPTRRWTGQMGGTTNSSGTIERYEKPEESLTSYYWPLGGGVIDAQNRVKRTLKQQEEGRKALGMSNDPYKDFKGPH